VSRALLLTVPYGDGVKKRKRPGWPLVAKLLFEMGLSHAEPLQSMTICQNPFGPRAEALGSSKRPFAQSAQGKSV